MKMGLIKPGFPCEGRVGLLPEHINDFENDLVVEHGFGEALDIGDQDYERAGCSIAEHGQIISECRAIFSLKVVQPADYDLLREGQMLLGWTHPTQSGAAFMERQAIPKKLIIVDLANNAPYVYYSGKRYRIDWIPRNFNYRNAFIAGYASTYHAILKFGKLPGSDTRVAILGSGNVSQGAFCFMSKLGADLRLFYRKTIHEFKRCFSEFDIIVNGIELDQAGTHILTLDDQSRLKKNCLIIDAAADAGRSVEGTEYTTISDPIYKWNGIYYYVVNNSPSIFFRSSSFEISKAFSRYVFKDDVQRFLDVIDTAEGTALG